MDVAVRDNKGFHPIIESENPYLFVDACMQAWPDADYANAHKHGVAAYCVTAFMPASDLSAALQGIMFWHLIAREHAHLVVGALETDIRRAREEGQAAFVLAAQGGEFIEAKLHRIEAFYRLGLRMLIPVYNRANLIGDGCLERTNYGLSAFGELLVGECNRVGMLIDCTHVGRRTSLEIIERSSDPVVFSHSNPDNLVENPRNITDEQLRACASSGGVIGLAPWGPLVMNPRTPKWPTVAEFADHVDYVANLLGSTNNIGIGTDMSLGSYIAPTKDPWGQGTYLSPSAEYDKHVTADLRSPKRALDGFNSYPQVGNLVEILLERGYSESDIGGILGTNFLRVFAAVWR